MFKDGYTTRQIFQEKGLVAIDEALTRLSTGVYGLCTICNATISEARLNAAPEAVRCIDCQEKAELSKH